MWGSRHGRRRASKIMSEQDGTGRSHSGDTPRGPGSTGCRLHKPEFDHARDAAEAWTGREGGLDHWALHARLEDPRVRERFRLKLPHVEYLRLSFKKLFRDDFKPGGCPPTVWIRKRKLAKKLGVCPRTVSNIEKDLARAGFLYWTDTASRHRDGRRRKQGDRRILWAYGVTFAPLDAIASEIEDAERLAEEEEIERPRAWSTRSPPSAAIPAFFSRRRFALTMRPHRRFSRFSPVSWRYPTRRAWAVPTLTPSAPLHSRRAISRNRLTRLPNRRWMPSNCRSWRRSRPLILLLWNTKKMLKFSPWGIPRRQGPIQLPTNSKRILL